MPHYPTTELRCLTPNTYVDFFQNLSIIIIVRGREERFLGEVRKNSEKLLTNLSNSDIIKMFQETGMTFERGESPRCPMRELSHHAKG